MPTNSRWDLIQGLKGKVSSYSSESFTRIFICFTCRRSKYRDGNETSKNWNSTAPYNFFWQWLNMWNNNLILMDTCIVDYSVEIPTRCSFVIEFIIPKFFEGSTCFERHTAHHQELQTVRAASGFYAHMVTGLCQGWVGNGSISHSTLATAGHHMVI